MSPQFHLRYNDFFETVHPTSGNPPVYSHWQVLMGLRKHEHPVRDTKSTPPKRVEHPEAIIIWDVPITPSEERDKEFTMEYLTTIDEYMPPSEGDISPPLPQLPSQEVTAEAVSPARNSSSIWKDSERYLESREQEYPNLNKAFSAVKE